MEHDDDGPRSMKLDKSVVQRRIDLMAAEGIVSSEMALVAYADVPCLDLRP